MLSNREVGESGSPSLLELESILDVQTQRKPDRYVADALDFTADGAERHLGRRHRLVKLRVPGGGYASYAIIDARWSEADVAQQLGTWIEAWKEQDADQVQALVASRALRRPDTR